MDRPPVADSDVLQDTAPKQCEAPIFVLTTSRSGSTLLRFILDSHPDIACPPETSVATTAAQLARTWDIVEGAGSDAKSLDGPGTLPSHVIAAVRDAVDQIFGRYLQRRGKRRWCDKSLDSYQSAGLIAALYPRAKFICLYRHCMDVIASGVEVCPWGLTRHGFDPFVAQHPGNSVAAIGSYWVSTVNAIMAFEQAHPDSCLRVRYEDLITAPEATASRVFSFLGAEQVPGITRSCFQTPHEANGPGDEKIWFTGGVTSSSMGRGVGVPAAALTPPILETVNQTLARLGYRQVDGQWNATLGPIDLRADPVDGSAVASEKDSPGQPELEAAVHAIEARLRSLPGHEQAEISSRWPTVAAQTIAMVVLTPAGERRELRWDFAPTAGSGQPSGSETHRLGDARQAPDNGARAAGGAGQRVGRGEPVATLIASPAVWLSLLDGRANMITELFYGRLRCVNRRDAHRVRSDETHAVAALLGLTQVPVARA
jgi:Sulfotransferase family